VPAVRCLALLMIGIDGRVVNVVRSDPDFASLQQGASEVARAVEDPVGSASIVAAQLAGPPTTGSSSSANRSTTRCSTRWSARSLPLDDRPIRPVRGA
jgi:hypothetical protein